MNMQSEKYIHNYRFPDVYCILVVDDKVNDDNVVNKNCFEACIKAVVPNSYNVLIDYAVDINTGFDKWRRGSYDLVLIDYDFSEKQQKEGLQREYEQDDAVPEFDFSSIFPEKQGLELFRFVRQLTENSYKYRKEFQSIYLWTSHRLEKGSVKGVKSELKNGEKEYYLQKEEDDKNGNGLEKILDILDKNKEQSALVSKKSIEYIQFILERLVFLYEKKKYNLQGYVALKKEPPMEKSTLYPPLVDGLQMYLFPFQPDSAKFYTCELDVLHYLELEEIKKPVGKRLYEKLISGDTLKRGGRFIDKHIDDFKKDSSKIYEKPLLSNKLSKKETKEIKFAGIRFDSDIWLAATPLTMVSCVGENNEVFNLLINKLEAFFKIGIGAVVLKTTYLESDGIKWPHDHIQRHHRTRVFTPSYTKFQLWNTGKTKLEAFPPKMLCEFLKEVKKQKKDWKNKIIVSLGVKPEEEEKDKLVVNVKQQEWKKKWNSVFSMVFGNDREKDDDFYPLVEINVRHFLRPILEYELIGDEYLAPIDESKIKNYKNVLRKFATVLKALHEIGIKYQKKLILKFPFRSDIIPFLKLVQKQAVNDNNDNNGIKGVTLINAAKSPYPHKPDERLTVTSDSIKMPQMSGEFLAWLRNYLLYKLEDIKFNLPVSVSGGVAITTDDIMFLRKQNLVQSIQLGTIVLKNIRHLKTIKPRIIHFMKDKCSKCGNCYNSFYCDAYLNRGVTRGEYPSIDVTACTGCGLCVLSCIGMGRTESEKALKMVTAGENESADFLEVKDKTKLDPRIIHFMKDKCSKCGNCYNSFYCDAYLNRGVIGGEYPLIDVTACTGCGLCVQSCIGMGSTESEKALKMVTAGEYVILCCPFSESRAFILREKGIPFMFMTPTPNETNTNGIADIKTIKEMAIEEAYERVKACYKKAMKTISKTDGEINPLESSIFLGLKTYIFGKENGLDYEITGVPSDKDEVKRTLELYDAFKAITAYSCWKDGKELIKEAIESRDFTKMERFNIDEYSQYGINKAGGIDILGHGSLLFGNLSEREKDVMTFAGLPLEAIKKLTNEE